jgi:hypothetical protein
MPIIQKELTFLQKELKKILQHGDRVTIQKQTGLSKQAVYQTLKGGRLNCDAVWIAAAELVESRKTAKINLDELIKQAIS